MEDEIISAFAFRTGKQIEQLIKEQTKILHWYADTRDEKFREYFNITKG